MILALLFIAELGIVGFCLLKWKGGEDCVARQGQVMLTRHLSKIMIPISIIGGLIGIATVKERNFFHYIIFLILVGIPFLPSLFFSLNTQSQQDRRDIKKASLQISAGAAGFIGAIIGLIIGLLLGVSPAVFTTPIGAIIGYFIGKGFRNVATTAANNINSNVDFNNTVDNRSLDNALNFIVDPTGNNRDTDIMNKSEAGQNVSGDINKFNMSMAGVVSARQGIKAPNYNASVSQIQKPKFKSEFNTAGISEQDQIKQVEQPKPTTVPIHQKPDIQHTIATPQDVRQGHEYVTSNLQPNVSQQEQQVSQNQDDVLSRLSQQVKMTTSDNPFDNTVSDAVAEQHIVNKESPKTETRGEVTYVNDSHINNVPTTQSENKPDVIEQHITKPRTRSESILDKLESLKHNKSTEKTVVQEVNNVQIIQIQNKTAFVDKQPEEQKEDPIDISEQLSNVSYNREELDKVESVDGTTLLLNADRHEALDEVYYETLHDALSDMNINDEGLDDEQRVTFALNACSTVMINQLRDEGLDDTEIAYKLLHVRRE